MEEEQLYAMRARLFRTGYQLTYELGCRQECKLWAKRTWEYGVESNGDGDAWLHQYKQYITKPERAMSERERAMVAMMKARGMTV